jgi:hypothetical protein
MEIKDSSTSHGMTMKEDKTVKYSLQHSVFPLCFAFTAQARDSLLRGLSGFFVARITTSGGALFRENANDQSTYSQRTPEGVGEIEITGAD